MAHPTMRPRSTQVAWRPRPAAVPALLVALLLLFAGGCATPVGVEPADPQAVHRELTGNVLSTGELSDFSANVLRRRALAELAAGDPAAALAELHRAALVDGGADPDELFALAELSFRHAEAAGGRPYHLAAAVYAFAYLFPEDGAGEGTLVIAEEQTAGRGRFGRQWVSPPGLNLYFTVVLRPDIHRLRALAQVAPLAVCRMLESHTSIRPLIKWPNDVLVVRRKLAGILIETEFAGENPRYALVGIGLNVNFRPGGTPLDGIATSIAQELDKEVSRERVLANLMNHLEELYRRSSSGRQV